jgi:hypothetical protein
LGRFSADRGLSKQRRAASIAPFVVFGQTSRSRARLDAGRELGFASI